MKKIILVPALLAAGILATSAIARSPAFDAPPPGINDTPDNIARPDAKTVTPEEKATNMNQPTKAQAKTVRKVTKEDAERAKKDLEEAKVRSKDPSLWPKTKIEETVDNHHQVTEIKVTPMSTQIPYVMRKESPSNQTPDKNNDSNLSVPKFINFGF